MKGKGNGRYCEVEGRRAEVVEVKLVLFLLLFLFNYPSSSTSSFSSSVSSGREDRCRRRVRAATAREAKNRWYVGCRDVWSRSPPRSRFPTVSRAKSTVGAALSDSPAYTRGRPIWDKESLPEANERELLARLSA